MLTLLHFGPTWEGMFWPPDLKRSIFINGDLKSKKRNCIFFINEDYLKRKEMQPKAVGKIIKVFNLQDEIGAFLQAKLSKGEVVREFEKIPGKNIIYGQEVS